MITLTDEMIVQDLNAKFSNPWGWAIFFGILTIPFVFWFFKEKILKKKIYCILFILIAMGLAINFTVNAINTQKNIEQDNWIICRDTVVELGSSSTPRYGTTYYINLSLHGRYNFPNREEQSKYTAGEIVYLVINTSNDRILLIYPADGYTYEGEHYRIQ